MKTICNTTLLLIFVLLFFSVSVYAAEADTEKNYNMSIGIGLGYDDNIYRTPAEAYLDYGSKNCNPATDPNCLPGDDGNNHPYIKPEIHSGLFVPIRYQIRHHKQLNNNNTLNSEYHFRGSFYTDSTFSNANQQLHRISVGNLSNLAENDKQKNNFYSGLFVGYKKRLYVDRDTGNNKASGPDDISQRYTYNFYGAELNYNYGIDNLEFDGQFNYQSKDYNSTDANVSEYDNTEIGLLGQLIWRAAKSTKLRASYEVYSVDYDQRSERNEIGQLFSSSPNRQYDYSILELGMRYRFSRSWRAYIDFQNKQRVDKYKGYDDYSKTLYKARIHYRINKRHKLKVSYTNWKRDYDNAYAFDNFTHGVKKYYEGQSIKLSSSNRITQTMDFNISYQYKNQDTTDLRYDYDRSLVFAILEWNY